MSDVKRYDCRINSERAGDGDGIIEYAEMSGQPDGDYVSYSDYAALRAERDAVYALGPHPVEQVRAIPLPDFVRSRFVQTWEYNEIVDERDKLREVLVAATEVSDRIHLSHVYKHDLNPAEQDAFDDLESAIRKAAGRPAEGE